MNGTNLLLLGTVALVVYALITKNPFSQAVNQVINLPPQEVTSPQQPYLGGLRSTNLLGFDITTAFANLRDNLSLGGLLFQGSK